jgi:hypothetical protein
MNAKNENSSSKNSSNTPSANANAASITPVATAAAAAAPASLPTPITSADAAQCQALLAQVGGILGPVTELSADDIRRRLKLRKGGAQVVAQLVDLCNQHGVTAVGPLTPDSLSAQKARAETLNTIGVTFAAVGKKLGDATFRAESDTWQQATVLYTVLQRLSVIDPTLAQGIQPVQAFFQTKKTKGKGREATIAGKGTQEQTGSSASPAGASSATNVPAPIAVPSGAANGAAHS